MNNGTFDRAAAQRIPSQLQTHENDEEDDGANEPGTKSRRALSKSTRFVTGFHVAVLLGRPLQLIASGMPVVWLILKLYDAIVTFLLRRKLGPGTGGLP